MAREQQWQPGARMPRLRQVQSAFAFMGQGGGPVDRFPIADVAAEALYGAVVRWCGRGHAISFGLSGDGGAFGVHLLVDGEKRSKWFGSVAEAEDFLASIPGPDATQ